MSIFIEDYDWETELRKIREDEYRIGFEEGLAEAREARALVKCCQKQGNTKDEAAQWIANKLSITLETAKEYVESFYVDIV